MSVKRKQQRIHTGVKMVGVKQLDELFKNAVIPLAECIQLRNALEAATVRYSALQIQGGAKVRYRCLTGCCQKHLYWSTTIFRWSPM